MNGSSDNTDHFIGQSGSQAFICLNIPQVVEMSRIFEEKFERI